MRYLSANAALTMALAAAFGMTSQVSVAQTSGSSFTVTETAVPGALAGTFTADMITGPYVKVITFNNVNNTFAVSQRWSAGQFISNGGTTVVSSQLGITGTQYQFYALMTHSGTYTVDSYTGAVHLTYTGPGTFNLYLDPGSDTDFIAPASGNLPWTTTFSSEDIPVGMGVSTSGEAIMDPALTTCSSTGGFGMACGSFGTTATLALTTAGSSYFTAPSSFYGLSFQSGQLTSFAPTATQTISGIMNMAFGQVTTTPTPNPGPVVLPNGKLKKPKKN